MKVVVAGSDPRLAAVCRALVPWCRTLFVAPGATGLGVATEPVWISAGDSTALADFLRREPEIVAVVLLPGEDAGSGLLSLGFAPVRPGSGAQELVNVLRQAGFNDCTVLRRPAPPRPLPAVPVPLPECEACGACCTSTHAGWVRVGEDDAARLGADLVERLTVVSGDGRHMKMTGDRCAALEVSAGSCTCTIYERRPTPCRELERDTRRCHQAIRTRLGRGEVLLGVDCLG